MFRRYRLNSTFGRKNIRVQGHDKTSRLIGSGPIRPPVRPSKGQSSVLQAIDHSVAGSMTAQPVLAPYRSPPTANRRLHWGGITPLQRCSWRILQLQPTGCAHCMIYHIFWRICNVPNKCLRNGQFSPLWLMIWIDKILMAWIFLPTTFLLLFFFFAAWNDGRIRGYYPESGKIMYQIENAHNRGVTSIAFMCDATRIISGGGEGQVRVWEVSTGYTHKKDVIKTKLIESMKEHKGCVTQIKVFPSDQQCVSVSTDGTCIIWNLEWVKRKKKFYFFLNFWLIDFNDMSICLRLFYA